jgi:hypothetical protein
MDPDPQRRGSGPKDFRHFVIADVVEVQDKDPLVRGV